MDMDMDRDNRIAELQVAIDAELARVDALVARYGDGVRPGWVGEEITMAGGYISRLRDRISVLTGGAE